MSGRIVVVGSVNVDLVVRGERLPGPGETVTGGVFERHHGGKGGNQAVAAARLGRPTLFVGAVGDDGFGSEARAALAAANVDVSRLGVIRGEATGVALILVDGTGENLISVAPGANARLTPAAVTEALRRLGPLHGDVVLVSREIPADAIREALRAGRAAGARTVLNPAPAGGIGPAELGLVDILTPNRGELAAAVAALDGARADGDLAESSRADGESAVRAEVDRRAPVDHEAQAIRLLSDGGVREAIVVTLGNEGALVVTAGGDPAIRVPAHPVRAVDATGAGDAFSGALAAMLATGHALTASVELAMVVAGLSTTVPGAREGMPTLAELEAALATA
jgi:ribokinase